MFLMHAIVTPEVVILLDTMKAFDQVDDVEI